jgi:hypothetical protein
MDPILTIGTTTEQALAYVGTFFTDLLPLIVLAIGLPLAFWVIKKVIGLAKAKA